MLGHHQLPHLWLGVDRLGIGIDGRQPVAVVVASVSIRRGHRLERRARGDGCFERGDLNRSRRGSRLDGFHKHGEGRGRFILDDDLEPRLQGREGLRLRREAKGSIVRRRRGHLVGGDGSSPRPTLARGPGGVSVQVHVDAEPVGAAPQIVRQIGQHSRRLGVGHRSGDLGGAGAAEEQGRGPQSTQTFVAIVAEAQLGEEVSAVVVVVPSHLGDAVD